MFSLGNARYYIYREATDMRKSFDGLCGLIRGRLGQSLVSGDVYIFINKPRNRIKLLRWEPGGFVLFYKRLERGTFELPLSKSGNVSSQIDYGELAMIITGISMKNLSKRKRFANRKSLINTPEMLV
mgnify:CR=1 FL=1